MLKTKIFLDSGDPAETKECLGILGYLDGQTTNPSLIAKNPSAQARLAAGNKFSRQEVIDFYQVVVKEISSLIPQGSVSIEVYADAATTADQMLVEARQFFRWIPNAHIKFPTTHQGLLAAEQAVAEGMRVNMTLCFTQSQAAAVHSATRGAKRGDVFVSPFVGRLDDRNINGMDLIANILRMYKDFGSQVEVLTASVRNLNHFNYAVSLGSDIITAPLKAISEWHQSGAQTKNKNFAYPAGELSSIDYREIDLTKPWTEFNIRHELTDIGMEKFSSDWNALIQ